MSEQILVGGIKSDAWRKFAGENQRDYDNPFVKKITVQYGDFLGRYIRERGSSQLTRLDSEDSRRKNMSDYLIQIEVPSDWANLEMCVSAKMVHVSAMDGGEKKTGILRRTKTGNYELQGFELKHAEIGSKDGKH